VAQPYTFVYANFQSMFPELSAVSGSTAQGYFNRATLVWRNDGSSPNTDDGSQQTFLLLLTAHIAALYSQSQGAPTPGAPQDANTPVGRIASAGQGTVNVTTETNLQPGKAAWYAQTKYGFEFWNATKAYRMMRYKRGALQPGGLPGGNFGSPWIRGGRW
jgi:hypothetical protein